MSVIYARDHYLGVAMLLGTLALLIWVVLWRKRSPAVDLWCSAALLGAVFVVIQARVLGIGPLPRLVEFPVLAGLGFTSYAFKALALHELNGTRAGRRPAGILLLLNLLVAAALALAPVPRAVFSAYLVGVMLLGLLALALAADRLAREQRLLNARLLCLSITIVLLLTLAGYLVALSMGIDALHVEDKPVSSATIAFAVFFALLSNGLFIGVVTDLAAQREAATEAALAAARLDRLRLEERTRMVADLHDGFGSQLTSARIRAEHGQLSPQEMQEILQDCLSDLHLVVDSLQDTEGGVGRALRHLRHRMAGRLAETPVRLHWDLQLDDALQLPPATVLHLLRIVQEAVNNALKHAAASNVWISAVQADDALDFAVQDDGRGLPAAVVEGNGLRNMRGRARRLGSELRVTSSAEGTRVEFTLRPAQAPGRPPPARLSQVPGPLRQV